MKSLIQIAITITMLAVTAGNLPKIIKQVRIAQIHLLMESRSSNWGRPWTPPRR